jgi:hypothetical protein
MKIFTILFTVMFTTMVVAMPVEEPNTQLTQKEKDVSD